MSGPPVPEEGTPSPAWTPAAAEALGRAVGDGGPAPGLRRDAWARLGAAGLTGLILDPSVGGAGLSPTAAVAALEGLARGCGDAGLLFALGAHLWGHAAPLQAFGDPDQRARWLQGAATGARRGALCVTEAGSGADALGARARAARTDRGWALHGEKVWVTNGPDAGALLVLCRTGDGPAMGALTAFFVPGDAPGLQRGPDEPRIGLRGCGVGRVLLDGVEVPDEDRVGPVGAGAQVFLRALEGERVGLSTVAVGGIDRLLQATVAQVRRRFGRSAPGAVGQALGQLRLELDAARAQLHAAAAALEGPGPAALPAALCKVGTSEAWMRAAQLGLRAWGAEGLREGAPPARALGDAACLLTTSGPNDLLRGFAAGLMGVGAR